MEPRTLLNADYLDIIFDNRNKIYGSYELRRNYDRRMKKAGTFAILGVSALLSFSFISLHGHDRPAVAITKKPTVFADIHTSPPVLPKVPTPPPAPVKHAKSTILTVPKIVNVDVLPEEVMTPVADIHDAVPGTTNTSGEDISEGPTSGARGGLGGIVAGPSKVANTPLVWVQQMPEFSGDMSEYLSRHLHYPESARSEGMQGQVLIRFVVNEDGSVTNATVERGIGGGCDEEALHIVSAMPKWKPGRQNGIPVKVFFTLPIKFLLN